MDQVSRRDTLRLAAAGAASLSGPDGIDTTWLNGKPWTISPLWLAVRPGAVPLTVPESKGNVV